jgi:peptidoglycan hydrolase CwlO-like protein
MKNLLYKLLLLTFLLFGSGISCTVVDTELLELVLEIKNQNEELLTEVKSLQAKSDSLVNEIKKSAAKQEELLKKVTELQAELAKVLSQITSLNEKLTSQDADLDAIKAQLADLQKKYEGILVQLEHLQKLSQILAEIEKLKAQLTDLNGKYQVVINTLAQNQQALDALKSQVTTLQSQLTQNLEKISQLTSQLGEQGADIEKILNQIGELKASCESLASLLSDLLNGGSGNELKDRYPVGSVFCAAGPTEIVDAVNPKTGKTWMDRNLGASRAAINNSDAQAYGDYYQWGRRTDGHQCKDSKTTTTLSSTDQPIHRDFILAPNTAFDWRSPQNPNLWQGVNGINNPCPIGYRVPTEAEFVAEYLSWEDRTIKGGYESPLRWVMTGLRRQSDGAFFEQANSGHNWASTINDNGGSRFIFGYAYSLVDNIPRATGIPVRCIKD